MKQIVDRFPSGTINIPLSKSEAHRILICAALAGKDSFAHVLDDWESAGFELSEDIRATAAAMKTIVFGDVTGGEVDCCESGSTLRFLLPVAAMNACPWTFTGRGRLLERPMDVFKKLFVEHGALYEQVPEGITVKGPLPAGKYELPGDVSSQFVSGLLFALPLAKKSDESVSEIRLTSSLESANYVDLTIDAMRAYGISIKEIYDPSGLIIGWDVPAGQQYLDKGTDPMSCSGDWSQAAFFLCAGALGRDVSLAGLDPDSKQGDRRIAEIIGSMGASVRMTYEPGRAFGLVQAFPPAAGETLHGVIIDARDIPDIVPPLAALACFASGETRFVGAGRLRLKESDRLAALAEELGKIGADINETPDGLIIRGTGGGKLPGGPAMAHGDHRIVMSLAVASIGCESPVLIDGAESVAKSYPNFWIDFLKNS